jgi:ketosteroid isomerase-like protein
MLEHQKQDTHMHLSPKEVFEHMIEAANRHDLETMVACFTPDYRAELPFTPERNFTGQAGVYKNWSNFFSTMPDFRVEVLSKAVEEDTVWAEVFFHGTQADGMKRMIQGIFILEIREGQIVRGKLYQNTVQEEPRL